MSAADTPDVASLIEQGDREYQQDAVHTVANEDGSWVIAVADGTGGGINAEEIAPASVAALPGRIASDEEMTEAFAAANRAARQLGTDESRSRLDEDLRAGWTMDPDTTLVVAAWTPEGGLAAGWIGDSVVVVVPADGSRSWYGRPQEIGPGSPLIGEFAAGDAPAESLLGTISRLSDDIASGDVARLVGGGALVAVLSDGAYDGYLELLRQPVGAEPAWPYCFDEDDSLDPLDALLSDQDRRSASGAASAIMSAARRAGLHDNASVAVACMRGQ